MRGPEHVAGRWSRTGGRYLPVALALILGVVASVAVFGLVRRWEATRERLEFEQRATRLAYALEQELDWHGEVLRMIEQLGPIATGNAATDPDDPMLRTFREFIRRWSQDRPGVLLVSWARQVPAAQRPAFDAALSMLGAPLPSIFVWGEDGARPAAQHADYFPILFVEPQSEAALRLVGFDHGSDPGRREAITRAITTGKISASGATTLVEAGNRPGLVVVLPAYERDAPLRTAEERAAALTGVVLASLDISAILERALHGGNLATATGEHANVSIEIRDLSDPAGAPVATHDLDSPGGSDEFAPGARPRYTWTTFFSVWGRQWEVTFAPEPTYRAIGHGPTAGIALFVGLLLSALLAAYLIAANERTARIAELAAAAQREVAERQHAESVLRHSEARFRSLVQNSTDVTLVIDERGVLHYVSESVTPVLGYQPGDLIERSVFAYLHPDDADGTKGNMRAVLAKPGSHPPRELRARHADGSWRAIEATPSNLIHDPAVQGIVYNVRDVSERKQLEAERRRAEEVLRQNEARFRSLVQHSTDIIMVLTAEGAVSYISPSVTGILGYDPEVVQGDNVFAYLHPDDSAPARASLARASAVAGNHEPTELRVRHADGSWRLMEATATNLLHDPSVLGIVQNVRDITERRQLEDQLTRQAFYDPLTGLPNRALFLDRLGHALAAQGRRQSRVAVVFVDLDGFKVVNDSLGHDVGDLLLEVVAQRLQEAVGPADTVARFAGDEFTVLLDAVADEAEAVRVTEQLVAAVSAPIYLAGHEVIPGASAGVALNPTVDCTPDALLRNADLAMYSAKQNGKGHVRVFDQRMSDGALARLELETDLRRAVEQGQIRLAYQPIIDLTTGVMHGVEALARWRHPRRGEIAPAQFIGLAEETGLIVPLGGWILEEACRQARRWQIEHPDRAPLVLSVNLSARQFQHRDVVAEVARVLGDVGLPPELLKLEITESVAMEDAEATIGTLRRLKALGVQLAIDDFGTGYSSLSYLRRFPVDTLKVDRSFVRGIEEDANERAIVRSVVALGSSLNLTVTAEGIESTAQLDVLRSFGCDQGQGFLLSVPLSAEAVSALLANPAALPTMGSSSLAA